MRARRASRLMLALLLLPIAAACNTNKNEAIAPTSTSSAPPPPQSDTTTNSLPAAPPVAAPLDARHFELDPCDSLTAKQQRTLGIKSAERIDFTRDGQACHFVRRPGDTVLVVFASNVGNGLSSRYIEHSSGTWNQWEPTEIDGYPALVFGTSERGECNFAVGITDSLYYWATVDDPDERCPRGRAVAAAVLTTIKAGN